MLAWDGVLHSRQPPLHLTHAPGRAPWPRKVPVWWSESPEGEAGRQGGGGGTQCSIPTPWAPLWRGAAAFLSPPGTLGSPSPWLQGPAEVLTARGPLPVATVQPPLAAHREEGQALHQTRTQSCTCSGFQQEGQSGRGRHGRQPRFFVSQRGQKRTTCPMSHVRQRQGLNETRSLPISTTAPRDLTTITA